MCISYLDNVAIGGSCTDILQDLVVMKEVENIDLKLNLSKLEIIIQDHAIPGTLLKLASLPGVQVVDSMQATFLDSLFSDGRCGLVNS